MHLLKLALYAYGGRAICTCFGIRAPSSQRFVKSADQIEMCDVILASSVVFENGGNLCYYRGHVGSGNLERQFGAPPPVRAHFDVTGEAH